MQRRHVALAATPPPPSPRTKYKPVFTEDPSSQHSPPPTPHIRSYTHRTSRNTITSLSLLVWKKVKHCETPQPLRSLAPPTSPLFSQRGETGPWCSRSTRLSQGCTPPSCWGTHCRRSRPQRRWSRPAWPRLHCCEKMSCYPASSTHCERGRTPPHSRARGSHRNRQQQTACLDRIREISINIIWQNCVLHKNCIIFLIRSVFHKTWWSWTIHTIKNLPCQLKLAARLWS